MFLRTLSIRIPFRSHRVSVNARARSPLHGSERVALAAMRLYATAGERRSLAASLALFSGGARAQENPDMDIGHWLKRLLGKGKPSWKRVTFARRLNAIDWASYDTAYGPAVRVPGQLLRLAGTGKRSAVAASHDLWCGLCHQHAFVSSAALPALPFILQVLEHADPELTVEILDILLGFAVCTNPGWRAQTQEWERLLRERLRAELPRFQRLASHPDEEVAGSARRMVAELSETLPEAAAFTEVEIRFQGTRDEVQPFCDAARLTDLADALCRCTGCRCAGLGVGGDIDTDESVEAGIYLRCRGESVPFDAIRRVLAEAGAPRNTEIVVTLDGSPVVHRLYDGE